MSDRRRGRPSASRVERPVRRLILTPTRIIVSTFVVLILFGTLLLSLPIAHGPQRVGVLEALFTSTSAVCVTGLAVVDTGSAYNGFGQAVILVLFQLGGLGLLTFGTFLALATGRRLGVGDRLRLQQQVSGVETGRVVELVRSIAIVVVIAEAVGAVLLYTRFAGTEGWSSGAWHAVFHSVSAFNNAGFSLNADSLSAYVDDPVVNLTVITLILLGGLGFIVIAELMRRVARRGPRRRLSLHTRVVLTSTGVLVAAGTTLIMVSEWNNDETLGALSTPGRVLASLFQAVTPRTAGFNTIDYAGMTTAALLVTMLLMFIGGNPGSTAGGVKTVTFAVIVMSIWSTIRGRADIGAFRRRLDQSIVVRAGAVAGSALLLGGAAATLLAALEPDLPLESILFETISALGTVGLSDGVTAELGTAARIVIIMLMFIGRIGLLTFALALVNRERPSSLRHLPEDVVVG